MGLKGAASGGLRREGNKGVDIAVIQKRNSDTRFSGG
jgi:hypothetical protein